MNPNDTPEDGVWVTVKNGHVDRVYPNEIAALRAVNEAANETVAVFTPWGESPVDLWTRAL